MASTELLSFYVREKEHIKVVSFDPSKPEATIESQDPLLALPTPKASLWSPNGHLLALAEPVNGVQVVDCSKATGVNSEEAVHTLPNSSKTTQTLQWSPNSEVLVAFSPAVKGSTEPNVIAYVVDLKGGQLNISQLAAFHYAKIEKDKKIFQWTPDSTLCARLLPDGNLQIVPGNDLGGEVLNELALAHAIVDFEFAPVQPNVAKSRLAIFVPDVRDDMQRVQGPAEVTIWELTSNGEKGDDLEVATNRKAVSNVSAGQTSELCWNAEGSALLAHCQTEVDETGTSYYGGSKLLLLSHDGSYQMDLTECQDGAPNGTSVQAVAWSPTRDEFVLIRGFQPAQATLWSWDSKEQKATLAKVLLDKAHRNTIRFNHWGSLLCLAGFGNLAGDVDFFGRRADEKCDYGKLASCQANCTVSAEWSRDGRHFLTAVLAPRMRVDNGIGIWRGLEGVKVAQANFEELFDAQWRPDPPGKPRFQDIKGEEVEQAIKDAAANAASAAPKKQAYRPPKARAEVGGNVAAMMRGEMAPDPDDRRSRKPRQDNLRPPVRGGEDGSDEQPQDRRNSHGKDASASPDPEAGRTHNKEPGWRPPPPDVAVPSPPPPKNAGHWEPAAGGYPQQAPKAAPQAKPAAAAPQHPPVQQAPVARKAAQPAVNNQQPWQQPPKAGAMNVQDSAHQGQAAGGHGQKLACPAAGWQYVDPKQNIQGPFSLLEMQQWHAMGYFRSQLPMRCDNQDRFVPFGELFPHPLIPFQSYPKRPGNHGMR